MANSHKTTHQRRRAEQRAFFIGFLPWSVVLTIGLVLWTYKDILYIRFGTDLLAESGFYTPAAQQLLVDGAAGSVTNRLSDGMPVIIAGVLACVLIGSVIGTFRRTQHSLRVTQQYMNAKRVSASTVVLMYIALRAAAFVVPVLYWCFFLVYWFPYLAKLPLRSIASQSPGELLWLVIGIIVLLSFLFQIGIVITKLAARVARRI